MRACERVTGRAEMHTPEDVQRQPEQARLLTLQQKQLSIKSQKELQAFIPLNVPKTDGGGVYTACECFPSIGIGYCIQCRHQ